MTDEKKSLGMEPVPTSESNAGVPICPRDEWTLEQWDTTDPRLVRKSDGYHICLRFTEYADDNKGKFAPFNYSKGCWCNQQTDTSRPHKQIVEDLVRRINASPKPTSTPHTPATFPQHVNKDGVGQNKCPKCFEIYDYTIGHECPQVPAELGNEFRRNKTYIAMRDKDATPVPVNQPTPHTVPLEWMREAAKAIQQHVVEGLRGRGIKCEAVGEPDEWTAIIARHSPHWVKIEEGKPETLPPMDVDVYLWTIHGWATVGQRRAFDCEGWYFRNHADFPTVCFTHWMLPAPPSEGETRK